MAKSISRDPVEAYARQVVSEKEVAGPLVRAACERHLNDLKTGAKRGLRWDRAAAEKVLGFFPDVLRLSGGEHEGKPFKLEPSQQFIVGSLFGWKAKDGTRRFRVAYVEIAKGNGKTPLAAGIGLYMLCADDEPRAEVYAAAVDKDQARILFRDAISMVDQSPELDQRLQRSGGRGKEWNLAYLETVSFFRPISSESRGRGKSGPRPHCALLDEVHEHPTDAMVEFMRAGTKGRRQALVVLITNSGVTDAGSVCLHYHDYAGRVLRGDDDNDSLFGYVCGLDKGDDWKDKKVWRKANPLLGVSISEKYLAEQVREAEGMPAKQSLVRRLNFCEWVESADPFVTPEVWEACAGEIALSELEGRACYGGLDLSSKNDLTALALVFDMDDGRQVVLPMAWTPADTLRQRAERDRAPYPLWVDQGALEAVPGSVINYRYVAQTLGRMAATYNIEAVAFDRWRIDDLLSACDEEGVEAYIRGRDGIEDGDGIALIEHGQGFKDMDPAIEALEDSLLEGNLRHGDHPVLTACIRNARIVTDPAGGRKFDKRKSTGRIDLAVALAMACNIAAAWEPTPAGTISFVSL